MDRWNRLEVGWMSGQFLLRYVGLRDDCQREHKYSGTASPRRVDLAEIVGCEIFSCRRPAWISGEITASLCHMQKHACEMHKNISSYQTEWCDGSRFELVNLSNSQFLSPLEPNYTLTSPKNLPWKRPLGLPHLMGVRKANCEFPSHILSGQLYRRETQCFFVPCTHNIVLMFHCSIKS